MKNNPEISIIVPVYNAGQYLEKCITSLLGQSFSDFELILVNDGSTDNSVDICRHFAESDSRIRTINKENGGVSSARNVGLDAAKGKYIMFCDSDDSVKTDFCKPLYELANGDESCLVFAGVTVIGTDNTYDNLCDETEEGSTVYYTKQQLCDLYVRLSKSSPFLLLNMPYNKLFSARVIASAGLRFDERMSYNEDFLFNLCYLEQVSDIRVFNRSIYNYNTTVPQSLCKRYTPNLAEAFRKKEDKLKSVIIDNATDTESALRVWYTTVLNDTIRALNNANSPSDPMSEKEKAEYSNKLIRNKRFRQALKYADKSGYNPVYLLLLRLGNYRLVKFLRKLG